MKQIITPLVFFPMLLLAQGGLTPPGAPAPTMHSLQEIYDELQLLQASQAVAQAEIATLRQQVTDLENRTSATSLHYATGGALPWQTQEVFDSGHVDYVSMAVSDQGVPAISFYDVNSGLYYGELVDGEWNVSSVYAFVNYGLYNSLAFGPDGFPRISFYDSTNTRLMYAHYDGSSWQLSEVDNVGDVGQYSSLAILGNGYPAIAYYDVTNEDLKYASYDGSSWSVEVVDGAGANVGTHCSLAVDQNGVPSIAYADVTNTDLKYATHNGVSWDTGVVFANSAEGISLAFSPQNKPSVSFSGNGGILYYASFGTSWNTQVLNADLGGFYYALMTSLSFGPDHQPAFIEYADLAYTFSFWRYDGSSWTETVIDAGVSGGDGRLVSMTFGANGLPIVSYVKNQVLKIANMGVYDERK